MNETNGRIWINMFFFGNSFVHDMVCVQLCLRIIQEKKPNTIRGKDSSLKHPMHTQTHGNMDIVTHPQTHTHTSEALCTNGNKRKIEYVCVKLNEINIF